MTCPVQRRGTIELYFYDELTPVERSRVQSHLRQCAACREVLDDLATIGTALAGRPDAAAPPGGDWSAFMARLDVAVRREDGAGAGAAGAAPVRRVVPYLAMAALLTLVTLSVLFVARQRPGNPAVSDPVASGAGESAAPRPAADPALVSLSGQHFERSRLVLLGLATKDADGPDDTSWAYEQTLAATLLDDTRLYRQAAEDRGMSSLAGVMQDLELVLLQTAMVEEQNAESLGQLQRLIRQRDLLTKMDVVSTDGS